MLFGQPVPPPAMARAVAWAILFTPILAVWTLAFLSWLNTLIDTAVTMRPMIARTIMISSSVNPFWTLRAQRRDQLFSFFMCLAPFLWTSGVTPRNFAYRESASGSKRR